MKTKLQKHGTGLSEVPFTFIVVFIITVDNRVIIANVSLLLLLSPIFIPIITFLCALAHT